MKYSWLFILFLYGCNMPDNHLNERLIYVKEQDQSQDLYSSDLLGQWEELLTNDSLKKFNPRWSSALNKVTYTAYSKTGNGVFLSLEKEVIDTLFVGHFLDINLSKNGKYLFYSQQSGESIQIWKMDVEKGQKELFIEYEGTDGDFELSLNEEFISFISEESGSSEIHVFSFLSKKTKQLTQSKMPKKYMSWSPSSEKVAFCMSDSSDNKSWDIFTLDLTDGSIEQITNTPYAESEISWSLSGDKIAFHGTTENDGDHIYTIDILDGKFTKVTSGSAFHAQPNWIPQKY